MNLTKKLVICVLGILSAAMPGYARQMSLAEAIQNAPGNFLQQPSRSMPDLLYTESAGDLNVAYVLANGVEGYVVLAADDVLPAVLGYSDSGQFDAASIPPAMAAWMQEYGRQLTYATDNGMTVSAAPREADHAPVAPLCKAIWSQREPFNLDCPVDGGTHVPAGCTATAMAQVMYAHKWPVTGTGTNTYTAAKMGLELTFDYGNTTFDWDNMIPSYASGYTPEQGAAVAKLLEACGNSALMNYGRDASGAFPYNAVYGMIHFMNYDKSAILLQRDYYESARWDELVYNELANGRPVMYGGYNADNTAGHTFVVDGYSRDGYYHLNWGWAGLSNGYFLLTALDPVDQGTGGSSSGYNYNQNCTINLMAPKDGSEYQLEMFWNGDFTTAAKNYNNRGTIEFVVGQEGVYYASTFATLKAVMGINLTPVDGGETKFYPGVWELSFASHYGSNSTRGYTSFIVDVASLPSTGEYIATPAVRYNDIIKDVAVRTGCQKSVKISTSKIGVAIEDIIADRTFTATDVKAVTTPYSGKNCAVSATLNNSGAEYHGMVRAGFANNMGIVLAWLNNVPVSVPDGKSMPVGFSGKLERITDGQPLPVGDYLLAIYDENNTCISEPVNVYVAEAPTGVPVYDLSVAVTGALSGEGTPTNPYIVEDEIEYALTINVSGGLFDDNVQLYAYYANDTSEAPFSGENSNRKAYFVGAGESQAQTYYVGTANFEPGRTVFIQPYGWSSDSKGGTSLGWLNRQIYLKRVVSGISDVTTTASGICPNPAVSTTTVTASSPILGIDVYSVTGARVMSLGDCGSESVDLNVSALQPGHYIVTVRTSTGTETHRLIKR